MKKFIKTWKPSSWGRSSNVEQLEALRKEYHKFVGRATNNRTYNQWLKEARAAIAKALGLK